MTLKKLMKNFYLSLGPPAYFHKKRFEIINASLGDFVHTTKSMRILEVGCGPGRDFAQFISKYETLQYIGIDTNIEIDFTPDGDNITRIQADARSIPFPDNFFDIVVSIGVLEHIDSIEDLCKIIAEIRRVGKQYCVIVPSITTVIEPHTAICFWQLRQKKTKFPAQINFFSDEAWSSFSGFQGCRISRFFFIPLLVTNTIISNPTQVAQKDT